jgi:hypothetical protein
MIKKALILISLLACSIGNIAQTATQQLVVWQKSGEKVYIDLAELPETTFEDGLLVIRGSKTSVQFQLSTILRYTYEGISNTGIEQLPDGRSISIAKDGDSVTLRNLSEGSTVSIYSANGTLIEKQTAQSGQPLILSVNNRPSGVYIVKAGKETIKLLKP